MSLLDRFRDYIGASNADDDALEAVLIEAEALVSGWAGEALVRVPLPIRDRAFLEVGSELWHRKNSPQGITQYGVLDGAQPVRVARDPMVAAYPLLRPFVGGGFA